MTVCGSNPVGSLPRSCHSACNVTLSGGWLRLQIQLLELRALPMAVLLDGDHFIKCHLHQGWRTLLHRSGERWEYTPHIMFAHQAACPASWTPQLPGVDPVLWDSRLPMIFTTYRCPRLNSEIKSCRTRWMRTKWHTGMKTPWNLWWLE